MNLDCGGCGTLLDVGVAHECDVLGSTVVIEGPVRCGLLRRRHSWRRTESDAGLAVECRRCGWGWWQPRLFAVPR